MVSNLDDFVDKKPGNFGTMSENEYEKGDKPQQQIEVVSA